MYTGRGSTLRLLNALNSEDRGLKVRFSHAMIVFETFELILCQMLSSQGKNAPSNPYPHYLVRLATSRYVTLLRSWTQSSPQCVPVLLGQWVPKACWLGFASRQRRRVTKTPLSVLQLQGKRSIHHHRGAPPLSVCRPTPWSQSKNSCGEYHFLGKTREKGSRR